MTLDDGITDLKAAKLAFAKENNIEPCTNDKCGFSGCTCGKRWEHTCVMVDMKALLVKTLKAKADEERQDANEQMMVEEIRQSWTINFVRVLPRFLIKICPNPSEMFMFLIVVRRCDYFSTLLEEVMVSLLHVTMIILERDSVLESKAQLELLLVRSHLLKVTLHSICSR